MLKPCTTTPAVVVGLCIHGLATVRALAREGIEVHALEANETLPGTKTRHARVHIVGDINGPDLLDNLITLHARHFTELKPVLIITNDNMVRVLGNNSEKIKSLYTLSWHHQRNSILKYIDKVNIEKRCEESGLFYPRTRIIGSLEDIPNINDLNFPLLAKPSKPLSSFKTHKFTDYQYAQDFLLQKSGDWPILVQEWVGGGDNSLYFCATYIRDNTAEFFSSGQKIESFPPAMGQTLIARSVTNTEIEKLTKIFFSNTGVKGPVSLEFKKDGEGRYWIIEPTLGRTDYWLDCVINAGINLPFIEYCDVTGQIPSLTCKKKEVVWYDTEKDPTAYFRYAIKTRSFKPYSAQPVFPYAGHDDWKPFFRSLMRLLRRQWSKLNRLSVGPANDNGTQTCEDIANTISVDIYHSISALPDSARTLLRSGEDKDICLSEYWFSLFEKNILTERQTPLYILARDGAEILLIIPLLFYRRSLGMIRHLSGLSNYYTTCYEPVISPSIMNNQVQISRAITTALRAGLEKIGKPHQLQLQPMNPETKWFQLIQETLGDLGMHVEVYSVTENWREDVHNLSFENYMEERPSFLKNTITRRKKKLNKDHDWTITIYQSSDDLEFAFQQYVSVYKESWKKPEPHINFLKDIALQLSKDNRLRLGILTIEGKPVAAQIWYVLHGRAAVVKLAHSEQYVKYSPGTLLTEYLIRSFFSNDEVTTIDFLMGKDSYKQSWVDTCVYKMGIEAINPRTVIGCLILAKRFIYSFIKSGEISRCSTKSKSTGFLPQDIG